MTVPGEQGLGRNDCGDVRQEFPPKTFRFRRQSPALIVVEPNASPSELLAKNAVFLTKVFDYQQLTLVHPAGDSNHDESGSRTLGISLLHYRDLQPALTNACDLIEIQFSDQTRYAG